MKTAIIVLNRNQPQMTDELCEHLDTYTKAPHRLFVIEAGSDEDKLSQHYTHWINDPWTQQHGLRPAKGFNRGIAIADQEGDWDFYWCVMNDMHFLNEDTLSLMLEDMVHHPEIGVLQPSLLYSVYGDQKVDGAKFRAPAGKVQLVPYMSHFCYLVSRQVLAAIGPLYDEDNFHSHGGDIEICWRAYLADFAVAISGNCSLWEFVGGTYGGSTTAGHKHFLSEAQQEMLGWLKKKYGFKSKHEMQRECARGLALFLRKHPEYAMSCEVNYLGKHPDPLRSWLWQARRSVGW